MAVVWEMLGRRVVKEVGRGSEEALRCLGDLGLRSMAGRGDLLFRSQEEEERGSEEDLEVEGRGSEEDRE